jgi:hypothetical protein
MILFDQANVMILVAVRRVPRYLLGRVSRVTLGKVETREHRDQSSRRGPFSGPQIANYRYSCTAVCAGREGACPPFYTSSLNVRLKPWVMDLSMRQSLPTLPTVCDSGLEIFLAWLRISGSATERWWWCPCFAPRITRLAARSMLATFSSAYARRRIQEPLRLLRLGHFGALRA